MQHVHAQTSLIQARAHQGLPVYPNAAPDPRIAIQGSDRRETECEPLASSFLLMYLAILDKVWIDAETRIIEKQMPIHVTAINRNDPPINDGFVPTIQGQEGSANPWQSD